MTIYSSMNKIVIIFFSHFSPFHSTHHPPSPTPPPQVGMATGVGVGRGIDTSLFRFHL